MPSGGKSNPAVGNLRQRAAYTSIQRDEYDHYSLGSHPSAGVTIASFVRERLGILRDRLRAGREIPLSVRLRKQWPCFVGLGITIAVVLTFDSWLATCGFAGCPSTAEIRAFRPSEGGRVLDYRGRLIGRLEVVRRVNVPLSMVPRYVQDAFIATEDRRFYGHAGIDWRGALRAASRNVKSLGVREGFSTITMQVARNSFLANRYHGRSLRRKLVELRLTRLLERQLTKNQILEHYLNVIYLGNGVNGVEAASLDLFGKDVNHLTLSEGAVLAALAKGPAVYTPRRFPERALRRRNLVLGLMMENGFISANEEAAAAGQPLRIAATEWRPNAADEPTAMDAVRAIVDSVYPDALKESDVTIYTTIDYALQRAADRAVARHASAIQRETEDVYGRVSEPAQGAAVAMDPKSGDIRAIVGGRRTPLRGGFNRAFAAHRQPGSAFKPFVYAAALAAGLAPSSMVDDDPVEVQIGHRTWTPSNFNNEYLGPATLQQALIASANAATVRVSRTIGEGAIVAAAHRNGIVSPLNPVPSIALGALEVTPLELVTAYVPFGNGGIRVRPRLVRRIEAPDGTVLWADEIQTAPAMDPRDAFELTQMLRGVVDFGTGRTVRDLGVTGLVAGKTGTTNNGADVWFIGFTPSLVAGVWFGYDTPRQIAPNATGGRLAAPAWVEMYQGWHESRLAAWTPPERMLMRETDPRTGELSTEWCPTRRRDWFKPGEEPTTWCHLHHEPTLIDSTGFDSSGARANPIDQLGRNIGKTLRRIFHW